MTATVHGGDVPATPSAVPVARRTGTGPSARVLDAVRAGATTFDEVARRADMDVDLVRTVVDQLRRMGRLGAEQLSAGCPGGGCGSCPSSSTDGCGSGGAGAGRGAPTLLTIRPR